MVRWPRRRRQSAGAQDGGAVLEGDRAGRRAGAGAAAATVAVKVTAWPKTDGLAEDDSDRRRSRPG